MCASPCTLCSASPFTLFSALRQNFCFCAKYSCVCTRRNPRVSSGFLWTTCLCSHRGSHCPMLSAALRGEPACHLSTDSLLCVFLLNAMPPLHYLTHFLTSIGGSSFHIGIMTPRNTPLLLLKNSQCLSNIFLQHRKIFKKSLKKIWLNSIFELCFSLQRQYR